MFDVDASDLFDLADDLFRAGPIAEAKGERVVEATTADTERAAKANVPVLSGELRDSIHTEVDGLTGSVIAGTDHGEYVEDGTSEMAPQPFMGPALAQNERPFIAGFERIAGEVL